MVGVEHYLKISASQLLRFGMDSVWKILIYRITQLMNELMNELINHEGVYRTAPATPGLLKTVGLSKTVHFSDLKKRDPNVKNRTCLFLKIVSSQENIRNMFFDQNFFQHPEVGVFLW